MSGDSADVPSERSLDLAAEARAIFDAAVAGARVDRLLARVDWPALLPRPLADYRAVHVVGAGKASAAMGAAVEDALAERGARATGFVVVPHGYRDAAAAGAPLPRALDVLEAGHPVPDAAGVDAARRALAVARACAPDDLLLALVSGGGSALWPAGAGDVTLDDMREVVRLLLRSGAAIDEINTVRKHLSLAGGGRLAEAAHPAELLALVISDVVGDDLSVIASGPTVPDATTFADAERVLRARGPWDAVPARVRRHVEAGVAGAVAETVKPGDACFARARTVLAGGNRDALAAARAEAERRGYAVRVVSERLVGEAREVGVALAREALRAARDAAAAGAPVCLLWGGETTVTVRGAGRGGRNQELALAAALALDGAAEDVVVLSGGTDGVDGPTDAAGGWATPRTAAAARAAGLDPRAALDANDSHALLRAAGALVVTGPTHTNVMDVQVALARPRRTA